MNTNTARWYGVFTIFVIITISYIDRINIAILITDHKFLSHIGLQASDKASQGLLATAFMVGYAVSSLLMTPFCEALFGVRRSLIYGLIMWGVVTLVTPLFDSYAFLLASRILLGLSEGPLFALAGAYVKAYFSGHENGKPNSCFSTGTGMGLAIGFPFIGFLVFNYGWQESFYVLGLLNLIIGVPLVMMFVRMPKKDKAEPQHFSFSEALSTRIPAMFKGAMQTRYIILVSIMSSFFLAYLWGAGSWLPAYLKEARGFSIREMGWMASLPQWATVVAVLLGGWLIDKLKREQVPLIFVGGSVGLILSVLVAIFTADRYLAVWALTAASFFWGLQAPGFPSTVQYYSKPEHVASAYGVSNGVSALVAGLMPAFMGAAIATTAGNSNSTASGFVMGFGMLVGSQVITLLCGLILWLRVRSQLKITPNVSLTVQ